MEIFSKVDPLMITVLDGSHEDFRQYLIALLENISGKSYENIAQKVIAN